MKQGKPRKIAAGVLLLVSVLLIITGVCAAVLVFHRCEQIVLDHDSHEALLKALRPDALSMLACGGMIVAGFCLLLILCLRLVGRSHREIRALRRKNEAVEQLNQQLQSLARHQRLEIIATLTSSIAHEFNNLLTPIMGYSLLALEKIPETDTELYDALVEVYDASQKAKTIISRLSDLSRTNSGAFFREVSLDELVRKTLDVSAPAKPEQVEVKLNLNCWDQRLRANELQLSQMLLNLTLNSFQAMPEGGTLTIDTWFDEDTLFLRVADTGCGIPEADLPHIFEPFFTTKKAGAGTGLGLAITAQAAAAHHGTIQVDSHVGSGTTFTVALPRFFSPDQQNSTKS